MLIIGGKSTSYQEKVVLSIGGKSCLAPPHPCLPAVAGERPCLPVHWPAPTNAPCWPRHPQAFQPASHAGPLCLPSSSAGPLCLPSSSAGGWASPSSSARTMLASGRRATPCWPVAIAFQVATPHPGVLERALQCTPHTNAPTSAGQSILLR